MVGGAQQRQERMRDSDGPKHVNAEALHRLVHGEIGRADARFGGARVVDEHVEPPVLAPNLIGGCRDAGIARRVNLEEDAPKFVGRCPRSASRAPMNTVWPTSSSRRAVSRP